MKRERVCPVCGNELYYVKEGSMKCPYCKRWLEVTPERHKGKKVYKIEEK